ncbi:MAG TPA: 50S ribosomal protein L3 [Phycisphaerales bacterium]|nr:50S ribosomal protein L3 [Phycisphaerales bacterium]
MPLMLMGRKLGMTRVFDDAGISVPVTVIRLGPCVVTQVKTKDADGYTAVQIGFDDAKPRRSTYATIGHDGKAGTSPKRFHREFHVTEKELGDYTAGQEIKAEALSHLGFVDVVATSKGKGFQGVMKRHGFKGMCASHGTERKHRSPGSIGARANDRGRGNNKKGIKMAGHMGATRVTIRSLPVVRIDNEQGLMLVKGSVPGANNGMVEVRTPTRLYRPKARKQAEMAKA